MPSRPVTVVSCLVTRNQSSAAVLLGVRRHTRTSARHPGVLSTPTMRIPSQLYETITTGFRGAGTNAGAIEVHKSHSHHLIGSAGSLGCVNSFVVGSLLCRKLALASALASGRFEAHATIRTTALDQVDDPLGGGEAEWTAMVTYELRITKGWEEIPSAAPGYSRLIWAPVDRLAAAVTSHDALLVDDSLDPFEVCIGGLCVRSAVQAVEGLDGSTLLDDCQTFGNPGRQCDCSI